MARSAEQVTAVDPPQLPFVKKFAARITFFSWGGEGNRRRPIICVTAFNSMGCKHQAASVLGVIEERHAVTLELHGAARTKNLIIVVNGKLSGYHKCDVAINALKCARDHTACWACISAEESETREESPEGLSVW